MAARSRSYLHANCAHCHRFNGGGASYINLQFDLPLSETGAVGKRPTQGTVGIPDAQIIAPGDFATWVIQSTAGKVFTGILLERTDEQVRIRDARGKEHFLAADEIDQMVAQRKSLMPDLLLRDMTAQQVADLLAYLASLK